MIEYIVRNFGMIVLLGGVLTVVVAGLGLAAWLDNWENKEGKK